MILLDKLLVGGLRFVLERIADAVDAETDDVAALQEDLLEARMRAELGEISEEEFERRESRILAELRDLREAGGPVTLLDSEEALSVDIELESDHEPT